MNWLVLIMIRVLKSFLVFFSLLVVGSCVDKAVIEMRGQLLGEIVVDGLITDQPGPYTIKLSKSLAVDALIKNQPLSVSSVILRDDIGNSEVLIEVDAGTYQTNSKGIQGVVGRKYSVRIKTNDGMIYESIPDEMRSVGDIDSLYYKFESIELENGTLQYGYRVFIDSHNPEGGDHFVRWRYNGIYQIETKPRLHLNDRGLPPCAEPDPPVCSGTDGFPCTCCICWVTQPELKPKVGNSSFVLNGENKGIEIGYVPINFYTFQFKYRVEAIQMSLSESAYNYWKIIQSQKEGSSSLFQPPTGKTKTNIFEINNKANAHGIFYASAISKWQKYIGRDENQLANKIISPIDCSGRIGPAAQSCLKIFPNSSNQPPIDWK